MSSLQSKISDIFKSSFSKNGYDAKFGSVVESQRPDLCQFQCNGALAVAKSAKMNPRVIAEKIVSDLENEKAIKNLSIAGPGFINISVSEDFIAKHINQINNEEKLGCDIDKKKSRTIIDFGGPNVAKPMHVGHLRSAIIGDSIQRLFKFIGSDVISDNHMGDWGTQMGMLICELKLREPNLPYFDENFSEEYPTEPPLTISDLELMYPEASKRCKANDDAMAEAVAATDELQKGRKGYIELWKHFVALSVKTLKRDFDKLDVSFDYWLGESFYTKRMGKLVSRLEKDSDAVRSEGALVLPVAEEGDKKEIPPVMLVKSGGGFLYGTSDIATIEYRMEEFNADRILYVVDKRQSLHFEQVFRAVRKTNIVKTDTILEHIGFGTVNGTDGKPFKTREGGVMKLGDLIKLVIDKAEERMAEAGVGQDFSKNEQKDIAQKIGMAALKFADLSNHRTSDYVFDIDKFSRFEGKTGPYLLYSAVRIKSILRKAKDAGIVEGEILAPTEQEVALLLTLSKLPDVLHASMDNYAPNILCDFAYELAQEFNRFYRNSHILREENGALQSSWLSISALALKEFELILSLLGIEIPERM